MSFIHSVDWNTSYTETRPCRLHVFIVSQGSCSAALWPLTVAISECSNVRRADRRRLTGIVMPMKYKFDPQSYLGLDKLGRIPLSPSFHLREFLYSEIAVHYGVRNVPDHVDQAVANGEQLCTLLLEPLQDAFGRIHIRSGYRSRLVNAAGIAKHGCAADNDGAHTWDYPSTTGNGHGAMACISVPGLSARILDGRADVDAIAWWIYDHLPQWSWLEFFASPNFSHANEVAFNIGWHEKPMKRILSRRNGLHHMHRYIPPSATREELWSALLK
jgi:hypothetical protein